MRIGFLANEYPPLPAGGIGTSVRNLARALVRDGHQVWVVGWGHDAAFDDHGVTVRFVGSTRVPKAGWLLNRRRAFRVLARLVREDDIEIVEAPDWCGPSAGLRLPCPVVVRCHGSTVYFADLTSETVARPSVRWTETRALRGADAVAAVSRFTADRTRTLFGLDGDITVLPNGIDAERFTTVEPSTAEPSTVEPSTVEASTVLSFGTLVRKKGVLDLGPMIDGLVDSHPNATLRLVGRDSADRRTGAPSTWALLERSLSAAGRARTEYLGAVPYATMQEQVRQAAICVFPSYGEALPLTWLEAMACSKPVVAYDIGWAREIVRHGATGLLVPAGDTSALTKAVASLLTAPDTAHRMGAQARADVEQRFTSEVAAGASLAWWRRVITEHRSA